MKKITKLLPIALAFLLMSPAFAATSDVQYSDYKLDLAPFLDIQKVSEKTSTTVTFADNYENLNLSEALSSNFRVYTNDAEQKIYLYAAAGDIAATEAPALYGEGDTLKLIFANISDGSGSVKATAQDIKSVVSTPQQSKNAFALDLKPTYDISSITPNGAEAKPTAAFDKTKGVVTYSMANGIYDFNYLTGQTAVDNSFNTYDTMGTYKATLTLSKTSI